MRILFLSAWFPYPPNNGSKLRIYNLLGGLAQYHEITLISLSDEPQGEPAPELKKLCQQIHVIQSRPYNPSSIRALSGLFSPKPRVLVAQYDSSVSDLIRDEIGKGHYDLVVASQWYMAAYLDNLPGVPAVFEEAEIGIFEDKAAQASSSLKQLRHKLTNYKMQRYFRHLLARFGACTVASEAERNLLQRMAPEYSGIEVIPNCVRVADYAEIQVAPEPNTLIFTGSFRYFANYEAMLWFLQEVYPLVKAQIPAVRLAITGDHAGKPLPQADGVVLKGFVDDIRPFIAASWLSVVPILAGGGTRLKILEAMALRTPVIATSKGAEGLAAKDGVHLLIADTPQAFAEATIRLLNDPQLRRKLADQGYELVRTKYDWTVILPEFLNLAERVAFDAIPAVHDPVKADAR